MRGHDADSRLLGLFDVLGDVINRADREGRAFVVSLGDGGKSLELMSAITRLCTETALRDAEGLAQSIRLLVTGSAAAALTGDLDSGRRGREMARDLIIRHRDDSAVQESVPLARGAYAREHDLGSYLDWGF